jgi:hypothetical protein
MHRGKSREPKWEPTCTVIKPHQAMSGERYCRQMADQAITGDAWQPRFADLGAGGRGFESRHPDHSSSATVLPSSGRVLGLKVSAIPPAHPVGLSRPEHGKRDQGHADARQAQTHVADGPDFNDESGEGHDE